MGNGCFATVLPSSALLHLAGRCRPTLPSTPPATPPGPNYSLTPAKWGLEPSASLALSPSLPRSRHDRRPEMRTLQKMRNRTRQHRERASGTRAAIASTDARGLCGLTVQELLLLCLLRLRWTRREHDAGFQNRKNGMSAPRQDFTDAADGRLRGSVTTEGVGASARSRCLGVLVDVVGGPLAFCHFSLCF